MQHPCSDEELVKLSLKDKERFGEIIDRYQSKLDRYIARLGVQSVEDRQDVLQDVFLKVYRNLNGFDAGLSFSSWIYRIAHNEAISWYRKKNVRPEGHLIGDSEEIMVFVAGAEEPADISFDKGINATELSTAMQRIDQRYREVLILRFFEHKEYEEISDILKIPTGSVGTLLHRGKKQLKSELRSDSLRI